MYLEARCCERLAFAEEATDEVVFGMGKHECFVVVVQSYQQALAVAMELDASLAHVRRPCLNGVAAAEMLHDCWICCNHESRIPCSAGRYCCLSRGGRLCGPSDKLNKSSPTEDEKSSCA